MANQSTVSFQSRVELIEQQFTQSSMARIYAHFLEKQRQFDRAPWWKRILMGGYFRRKYLTYMLEWVLDEYLWESSGL
ncbi:hypothetical protein ACFPMF_27615 [Larkinella bovis]|uniref:Uncharacterized protein n=1 Tax=Larkinella bovis TaxID=683041 RepID=A0ABW0IIB8_9BACT